MSELVRVLLIPSSDYLGHPFPQRHNHIFERLNNKKRFEVHVIRFNIFGRPKLKSNCVIHELPIEIKSRSTPLYYIGNISTYTAEILKIIKKESIDIVVAGNLLPPLTYRLVEKLKEKKLPFIFDLQDYFPTSALGYITRKGVISAPLRGLFELITQTLIKTADLVTVPGLALAYYAKNVGAKKVEIVPNGISEHFLKIHDGSFIRKKLGINHDEIVVGYIGSIEFWLDMRPLLKAVSELKKENRSIRLLIIGKNLQTQYVKKVARWINDYGINNITIWLDFVPYSKVPLHIAAMNIGTVPFDVNNLTAYYAAPNKIWEYLSQGLRVIATPIPEAYFYRQYIELARNYIEYINIIKKLIKYNKRSNLHQSLIKYRNWNTIKNKYENILKMVKNLRYKVR